MKRDQPPSPDPDATDLLSVDAAVALTDAERAASANLDVFANFAASSRPETELAFVRVRQRDRLVAVAPFARLRARRISDLLRPPWLRAGGRMLGPLLRRTLLLLDTTFRAYDYAPPILQADDVSATAVRDAVLGHLCATENADAIWIAEPEASAAFAGDRRLRSFPILPMVHVRTNGAATLDEYLAQQSKKRRRNYRTERRAFDAAGAVVTEHEAPLPPPLLAAVLACLEASAARSTLHVPYSDLLNDPAAFARQEQTVLVAQVGGEVIGFFSLVQQGNTLLQTHGGLDYERSIDAHAYHCLTYAAIDLAIRRGCERLSLGPLNNETKRRCGTDLMPVVASLWCRRFLDRFLMDRFLIPRLQVYRRGSDTA